MVGAPELKELPPFRPRWPWLGGDLQTLRNWLVSDALPLQCWPAEAVDFDMADDSGDVLIGFLHQPVEALCRPLVILIHGLTGSSESRHIRASAAHLLEAGYPVLRLNLRGAGPSIGRTKSFYHAGRSDDLHRVIGSLDSRLAGHGVVMVGYSLAGNLVLKYLAEQGANAAVMAGASVSAPIDLYAAERKLALPRNRLYHQHLLAEMKRERGGELDPDIRSMIEFDERVVVPAHGFKDVHDYYRQSSAGPLLGAIRRPSLIIHASDDPWIPVECYRDVDWSANPYLVPLVPTSGGHVGFHAEDLAMPWHDAAILRFLASLGQ